MKDLPAYQLLPPSKINLLKFAMKTIPAIATPPKTRRAMMPLRVGVLVNDGKVPQWMLTVLAEIRSVPHTELVLIRVADVAVRQRRSAKVNILFEVCKSLDRRIFARRNDAFFLVEIPDELRHVAITTAKPSNPDGLLHSFDLQQIKAARLDVILNLGHDDLIPQLLDAARDGVLSFGNERTEARAFWEIYEGYETSDDVLLRHVSNHSDVLARATVASDAWSVARHLNKVCWRRAKLVKRALLGFSQSGFSKNSNPLWSSKPRALAGNAERKSSSTLAVPSVSPSNMRTLKLFGRKFWQTTHRLAHRFFFTGHWFVGVRTKQANEEPFQLKDVRLLTAPRDRFFADPFVLEKGNRNFLFFEEFPFATRKGVISCVEFDDSGFIGRPRVVLETGYHLSYPFLFQWNGQIYLLPEMRETGQLCLFRATDFPFRWELERVLMEGVRAADPTLLQHDGKFWLFLGGGEERGLVDSELFLYFANTLDGAWTPHPRNPIVSDVTRARPAGQIFSHDGRLIRPGQDCSQTYGRAVVFNRIEELSVDDYRETPIRTLEPDWQPGNIGTHTFNQSQNYQVLDGRFFRFRLFGDSSLAPVWSRYWSGLSLRRL